MGQHKMVLEELKKLNGIEAALIFDDAGAILEQDGELSEAQKKLTYLVTQSLQAGEKAGNLLRKGYLEQSYIEFKDSNVTFLRLSVNQTIAAIAAAGANLGRIRHEIKKCKKMFEEMKGDQG